MVEGQQFLGGGDAGFDDFLDGREVDRFGGADAVAVGAGIEAGAGEFDGAARDVEQRAAPERRIQRQPRHVVAQFLALLIRPVLDEIPGRVERGLLVKQTDPEGRKRADARPRSRHPAPRISM